MRCLAGNIKKQYANIGYVQKRYLWIMDNVSLSTVIDCYVAMIKTA